MFRKQGSNIPELQKCCKHLQVGSISSKFPNWKKITKQPVIIQHYWKNRIKDEFVLNTPFAKSG